jgi:hypothetical protein
MNDARHEDKVVELDPGWRMDVGAPEPILVQTEDVAALLFHSAPDRKTIRRTVLVVFDRCTVSRFGYPNDEALASHPLYSRGLGHYGCYEVIGSSWRSQLETQDRVMFPASHGLFTGRHFVITFHDSTFECIADDMRWEWITRSIEEAVRSYLTPAM